jgi:hypothetical protein
MLGKYIDNLQKTWFQYDTEEVSKLNKVPHHEDLWRTAFLTSSPDKNLHTPVVLPPVSFLEQISSEGCGEEANTKKYVCSGIRIPIPISSSLQPHG